MKKLFNFAHLSLVVSLAVSFGTEGARAQSGVRPNHDGGDASAKGSTPSTPDGAADASKADASARTLYDEASTYAQHRFDEFRKSNTPFDRTLEQKTLEEQKELALRNVTRLVARGPLHGTDLYYAGLLYSLAGKGEGALDSMRHFL